MSQFGASQKSYQKPWGEVDQIGEGWATSIGRKVTLGRNSLLRYVLAKYVE